MASGFDAALAILVLILVHHTCTAQSSDQGSLRLACGRESEYFDPRTNLTWFPDAPYIDGLGRAVYISKHSPDTEELYSFLRYFDETKSCYRLPTSPGDIYMVRGTFYYGDYDSKSSPPWFNVSIDATLVHTITLSGTAPQQAEIVFEAGDEELNYCLIAATKDLKPVISTLELRPLQGFDMPDGLLETISHLDAGSDQSFFRDSDFTWTGDDHNQQIINASASYEPFYQQITNASASYEPFYVPREVMNTAATFATLLKYQLNAARASLGYHVCLHFLELESSVQLGDRVFDVFANNKAIQRSFDILSSSTGDSRLAVLCFEFPPSPNLEVLLVVTAASKKGPILNALEVYHVIRESSGTFKRDVNALLPLKHLYPALKWSGDPCLPQSTNWDGIVCDEKLNKSTTVAQVNLSSKGLNGTVPLSLNGLEDLEILQLDENMFDGEIPNLQSLQNLQKLRLDNNNLNGTIPEYLTRMPKLDSLHLENNNLQGFIPSGLHKIPQFTYFGNPLLRGWADKQKKTRTLLGFFIGGFAGGFFLLLCFVASCSLYVSRKRKEILLIDVASFARNDQLKATPEYVMRLAKEVSESNHIRRFSLLEVTSATSCFKTIIGEGGFGTVYYGTLSSGQAVAVKARSLNSIQGTREFNTELNLLSRFQHENLVPLLGFCTEEEQEILVYPLMPNGSLQDRLYGEGFKRKPLDWPTRLSIALGAAKGLAFLHNLDSSIIHRDVKSSNILLDESMTPKVADFGFSKYAPQEGDSVVSLEVRGTAGYLDPD